MFYTDELKRLRPLTYILFACLVFWAAMFYVWPLWTGVVFAAALGVMSSFMLGVWLRDRIRGRISERDKLARREIQESIDAATRDQKRRNH